MKSTRQEVYAALDTERAYQERVWDSSIIHAQEQSVGDAILLVEEYAAKARLAWSQQQYPETNALDIMRKIGGIAVRCMETHGAINREP